MQTGHSSDHMSCVMLPLKEGASIFQRAAQKCTAPASPCCVHQKMRRISSIQLCMSMDFFKIKVHVDSLRQLNSHSLHFEDQCSVLEWRCSFLRSTETAHSLKAQLIKEGCSVRYLALPGSTSRLALVQSCSCCK